MKGAIIQEKRTFIRDVTVCPLEGAFKKLNVELDYQDISKIDITTFPFQDYDFAILDFNLNSLWISKRNRKKILTAIMENIPNIFIFVCDVSFAFDPYVWDKGESSKDKVNWMKMKPLHIIASFSEDIIYDKKAMHLIQKKWMEKVHSSSQLHFIEWISFYSLIYKERFRELSENTKPIEYNEDIRYFYYGIRKKNIANSLKSMGLGDSEQDAVFGNIADYIPNVKNLSTHDKKDIWKWRDLVKKAEAVLFPYEPIKSEYQITLRMLECMEYYPNNVLFDERIPKNMQDYCFDIELWNKKTNEELLKLQTLLDSLN